uniref:Aflatoxin regulatory protein domain-containing protein n=1 Tax=Fusarium oxysporum (strain Fo5176) TaxID=660025 RepID=A0A0D2Y6I5_FUSOF
MAQADLDLENTSQIINPDLKMSNDFMAGMDAHLDEGQWWDETTPIQTLLSNIEASDDRPTPNFSQELTSQAMAVSTKTISATIALLHPGSAPTVSSQYVNQAFDGTRTLGKSREKTAFEINHSSSLIGDPAPSSAQFTMVLQLLVHLINRLDRCLFAGTQTPSPNTYQGVMDLTRMEKNADELGSDRTSIAGFAQGSITGLSQEHRRLRQIISQLQGQMDTLEEV